MTDKVSVLVIAPENYNDINAIGNSFAIADIIPEFVNSFEAAESLLVELQNSGKPIDAVYIARMPFVNLPDGSTFSIDNRVVSFIKWIRNLSDSILTRDGIRVRKLPIVASYHSSLNIVDEINEIDENISVLSDTVTYEDILKEIFKTIRLFRKKLLEDFHLVGIGIRYEQGIFKLHRCYSFTKKGYESEFIDLEKGGIVGKSASTYIKLLAIEDHEWNARQSILQFEYLLNSSKTNEKDFQNFFSSHPEYLAFNYKSFEYWSEPILKEEPSGEIIKPDFLLKPASVTVYPWEWRLIDLKKHNVPILTNVKSRPTLSQEVHKVVSQLKDYSKYFDNPANRKSIENRFGGPIKKPNIMAVIGRIPDDELWEVYSERKSDQSNVTIVTYDEILEFRKLQIAKYK